MDISLRNGYFNADAEIMHEAVHVVNHHKFLACIIRILNACNIGQEYHLIVFMVFQELHYGDNFLAGS
ncbi:hypothetical protein D3C86_2006130 [compost metagenome]